MVPKVKLFNNNTILLKNLGLDEILEKNKSTFLADVDFTCISDNYWLGKKKPCLTYGLRYFIKYLNLIFLEVSAIMLLKLWLPNRIFIPEFMVELCKHVFLTKSIKI